MSRQTVRVLIAGVAVSALFAGPANGAAQISLTFPAPGSVISRSSDPTLFASGTVTLADPVPAVRTYNLRRDACGGSTPNNVRMSLRAGTDVSGTCGSATAGLPNEVLATAGNPSGGASYPAVDGLPAVLDTTKQVTGTLSFSADVPVGIARVEVALVSNAGTVGFVTVEKTLQGDLAYDIPFAFGVAPGLAGQELTSLALTFRVRGVGAANGFLAHNGASFVKVPVMDPGLVEVSTAATFSASRSVYALVADGAWEAEIATPTAGERSLFARVVQNGATVASTQTTFTVVP